MRSRYILGYARFYDCFKSIKNADIKTAIALNLLAVRIYVPPVPASARVTQCLATSVSANVGQPAGDQPAKNHSDIATDLLLPYLLSAPAPKTGICPLFRRCLS